MLFPDCPGGLLLVVSHLFALPVSVLWVGFEKKQITELGCEKYFAGSHNEDSWRWLNHAPVHEELNYKV
jgi:hypothetical protein